MGKNRWAKLNKKILLFVSGVAFIIAMSLWLVSCGGGSSPISYGTTSTYSISGQATSGGVGLAGVTMTLSGAASSSATTDAGGNYTFSGLSNGSYTVTPSKSGYMFNPSSAAETVNGGNVTGVNYAATANALPTFSISGTVTSNGVGLSGVTMTLSGAGSAAATTDASGNYTLSGLPGGIYTVTPSKSGYTFNPSSSPQTVSSVNITGVNFIAASLQAVQMVACPSSGTTDVTIQDFIFSPSNATISVNGIVKWTNIGPSTHTVTSGASPSVDGKFDSGGLAPGDSMCMKFTASGTCPYFCSIHNFMTGSVTVQ